MDQRTIVERFCDHCGWAWTIRNQYRILYECSEDRCRLLETAARDFFGFMREVLADYIYLQFGRLTDAPSSGRVANLTAPYIANELEWPPEVRDVLRKHLKILLAFRKKVILPRHKLIAHADLEACLQESTLGSFPEGEDNRFFESLQEFVNVAHDCAVGGPYPLDAVSLADADTLVKCLRRGVAFESLWADHTTLADQLLTDSEYADA